MTENQAPDLKKEEIDIRNIFIVLNSNRLKIIIPAVLLLLLSLPASLYFSKTNSWEATVLIGGQRDSSSGRPVYFFDDQRELIAKINSNSYRSFLEQSLGTTFSSQLKIKAKMIEENTPFVVISVGSKDSGSAKTVLDEAIKNVIRGHEERYLESIGLTEKKNSFLNKDIEIIKEESDFLEKQALIHQELSINMSRKINALQAINFSQRDLDAQLALIEAIESEGKARSKAEELRLRVIENKMRINVIGGQVFANNMALKQIFPSSLANEPFLKRQSFPALAFRNGSLAFILGAFLSFCWLLLKEWFNNISKQRN